MKISSFRVKNYKSILDSKECYPSETITILAGKNEAGKSSLLEALSDFNPATPIRKTAIPITDESKKPSIAVSFEVKKSTLEIIYGIIETTPEIKNSLIKNISEKTTITIEKTYPAEYAITGNFLQTINNAIQIQRLKLADDLAIYTATACIDINDPIKSLLALIKINKNNSDIKKGMSIFQSEVDKLAASLPDSTKIELKNHTASLQSSIDQLNNAQQHLLEKITIEVRARCPNIILFSSFDDVFPNEITFSDLEKSPWAKDLSNMSDFSIETIKSENSAIKKQHKHKLNLQINKDFSQFWSQDLSKLSIDWDGDTLYFWIEENNFFYPPEMRSQGRRWHLAFYIKISSRSQVNGNNILLIDEPGLYLHATAQRDIIKHLEASSDAQQIIISTHSPYLIEPDKLDRLRLVLKNDIDGTYVENKLHAVSDKETLTPILTAIGLELNQGITSADRKDNIVVEGVSDYFYLNAIRDQLEYKNINFISGGGAGNMTKVGTILQGWGCKVLYLFDDDNAYKTAQKNIRREWVTISKEWLSSLDIEGSIEDIFTKEEFAKIINSDPGNITTTNSEHMKLQKLDKVLPSRKYLDMVRKNNAPALSIETKNKAKIILDNLQSKLQAYEF